MSRQNSAYCKVCADSGKAESVFKNHNVKDRHGVVICPTLLSQECRYCMKPGHTIKFCAVLQNKKKNDAKNIRKNEYHTKQQNPLSETKKQNRVQTATCYASLMADSDDEEENSNSVTESTSTPPLLSSGNSYAEMLKKTNVTNVVKNESENMLVITANSIEQKQKEVEEFVPIFRPVYKRPAVWNWADDCDSSDDEYIPEPALDNSAW